MKFPGLEILEYEKRQVVKASLKTTLHLVLKFNSNLKSALMGEEIAASALLAVQERNNPTLDHSLSFRRTVNPSSSFSDDVSPYLIYNVNRSQTFSSRWSRKLSNGISYSATFSENTSRNRTYLIPEEKGNLEDAGEDEPFVTSSLTLGVAVPIFQDWGEVNDIPVFKNEVRQEDSKTNTLTTELQILETFARIYWDLAGLWKTQSVLQEAIKLSEQLVEENRILEKFGKIKPLDIKQSEIQLLKNQQSLLQIENSIRTVEDQVKVALNVKNLPYGFLPGDTPRFRRLSFIFDQQLEKVYHNSSELMLLQSRIKSNQYDLEEAFNQDEPDLDLSLSYTLGGGDKNFSNTLDAYERSELHGYQVGLTWSVPLFDQQTPELIKQKKTGTHPVGYSGFS